MAFTQESKGVVLSTSSQCLCGPTKDGRSTQLYTTQALLHISQPSHEPGLGSPGQRHYSLDLNYMP